MCVTEGRRVQRSQTRQLSSGSREEGGRQAEDSPGQTRRQGLGSGEEARP